MHTLVLIASGRNSELGFFRASPKLRGSEKAPLAALLHGYIPWRLVQKTVRVLLGAIFLFLLPRREFPEVSPPFSVFPFVPYVGRSEEDNAAED